MSYIDVCREKAAQLKTKEKVNILAIESSCDETAAAVIQNGRVILSNEVFSQIPLHALYGGVVPEIASRAHVDAVDRMVDHALKEAGLTFDEIDAIGVTCGPGLVGALLTGVSCAKGLAYALEKPLIPVNHIEGHICANYIANKELEPPFMCLIVSGGHTHLVKVADYGKYEILGKTEDDAAGEAFDKVARAIGLGYPGGPKIDKVSKSGNPEAIKFPRAKVGGSEYDFSFSGLKSAVLNYLNTASMNNETIVTEDVAASFQQAVIDVLVGHSMEALSQYGFKKFAIAGGVASNSGLREAFEKACAERQIEFFLPPPILCTDNAAMIGSAAYFEYISGVRHGLDLNAVPNLKLGERVN